MKLFESGRIGRLAIKNRIVMAAMGTGFIEPDGRLSRRAMDYYIARAKGGVGLILTSAARTRQIEQLSCAPLVGDLVLDSRIYVDALAELADSIHDYGAKVGVQITAGQGRNVRAEIVKSGGAVAPSPLPCFVDPTIMARELTTEEVENLVQGLEFAAEIANAAGVDAIELNCHSGYLFDEFQTSLWNKRTDKYGGDLESRLRFVLEVIERMKKVAGAEFPIIVKFGVTHYLEGGRGVEEGLEIARILEAAGVDALDIDAGCYETMYWGLPPTTQPPGCLIHLAEMVKKVVNIPVIAVGKLGLPELAERVLQEGKADFIALGRPLLADPEWANKVKEERQEEIRPCIGDHEGCLGRFFAGKSISCTVNPMAGMEREFAITPAERKKAVLVVGGGPGGMEAGIVAALRGHNVTLLEKCDALGGNLMPASIPDFKQEYRSLLEYLSTQIRKVGVNIRLETEATPELIQEMKPQTVIIATGATPIIPEIPGVEKETVITAVDLLLAKKKTGASAIVLGGGLVGCETALYLAQKGKRVMVVEILDSVMRDMVTPNRMHLLKLLADANVEILTETTVLEITDGGVNIIDKCGKASALEADTVVLALGLKSDGRLLEASYKVPKVYGIGDCMKPRKTINAIHEGFRISRLL